ncbi:TPR repeat protein [Sphingobium herbicidovorans NBRC 16415]|uniref:TPR repeat protein n=1 Tax=Sphingobium herbicidovorans (strain ATCC 700291 / DSM 11019 / CCUG 56400 / KCTC 2939 / LMG 18315 / NBRC 16415 / MH) TaxID=1219045 RepID=A0A086P929_SPHHM|nr:tetratricopeptide repeat protein [Sphingobium herbicidovorans]KFG89897.1 TPR repeat protein [Sphingobium herbicidovorans NBRC 16415]
MVLFLPLLLVMPQSYDPEIEAIMNRPKKEKGAAVAPRTPASTQGSAAAGARIPVPEKFVEPFQACLDQAMESPDQAVAFAQKWRLEGGSFYARHCMGFAYAQAERWAPAIVAFEQGADEAERSGEMAQGARLWAQAGNAALASGDAAKARTSFDAALARGLPDGIEKGETQLDQARALVALGDAKAARDSLDAALTQVPQDPLAWLLSATLARRSGELKLAQAHIARAVQMSPDDASVALEEGNIAVLTDHPDIARSAWQRAVALAPQSTAGKAAADNLTRLSVAVPPAGKADRN